MGTAPTLSPADIRNMRILGVHQPAVPARADRTELHPPPDEKVLPRTVPAGQKGTVDRGVAFPGGTKTATGGRRPCGGGGCFPTHRTWRRNIPAAT